eukprot:3331573-Rhodomonas_salina.3
MLNGPDGPSLLPLPVPLWSLQFDVVDVGCNSACQREERVVAEACARGGAESAGRASKRMAAMNEVENTRNCSMLLIPESPRDDGNPESFSYELPVGLSLTRRVYALAGARSMSCARRPDHAVR